MDVISSIHKERPTDSPAQTRQVSMGGPDDYNGVNKLLGATTTSSGALSY